MWRAGPRGNEVTIVVLQSRQRRLVRNVNGTPAVLVALETTSPWFEVLKGSICRYFTHTVINIEYGNSLSFVSYLLNCHLELCGDHHSGRIACGEGR